MHPGGAGLLLAALAACGGGVSSGSGSPPASAAQISAAVSLAANAKPNASGPAAPLKLTVAYSSLAGSFAPPWMAEAVHAFEHQHLNVEMRYIPSSSAAVDTLIANEVDVLEQSASAVLNADLNGHQQLVFVASELNHAQFVLEVAPPIRSAGDVRGKVLSDDRPGTPSDFGMKTALSLLGLKPSDVQIRPLGGSDVQYAALVSKQVVGGILAPPYSFQAEAKGFYPLQDATARPTKTWA